MVAANKTGNYVLLLLAVVGFYFAYVYIPPWVDNYQLKNSARAYISGARQESQAERARERFMREAREYNIKVSEEAVIFERLPDGQRAKVSVDYVRDYEFPIIDKRQPKRWRWSVTSKYAI